MKTILLSTSSLWNCGDDFIRKGLLDLMRLKPNIRMLWWNRAFGIKNAFVNDLSVNLPLIDYLIIAGTPEWINRNERLYRHCLEHQIPISIIGVGTRGCVRNKRQLELMEKVARSGLVEVCMARDKIAMEQLVKLGFNNIELILDPAFFMEPLQNEKVNNILCWRNTYKVKYEAGLLKRAPWYSIPETIYSIWKTKPKRYNRFMKEIFLSMVEPKLVVVHDNREIKKAEELFGKDYVYYSVDYMDMLKMYSTAKSYIGSRIHGAIPSAIHGSSVHLIYPTKKADVIQCCIELLKPHIADIEEKIKVDFLTRGKLNPADIVTNDFVSGEISETLKNESEKIRSRLKAANYLRDYME